jgi:hypothetical protein
MIKFELLKKSKFSQIVNFRVKIEPLNDIQNTKYDI